MFKAFDPIKKAFDVCPVYSCNSRCFGCVLEPMECSAKHPHHKVRFLVLIGVYALIGHHNYGNNGALVGCSSAIVAIGFVFSYSSSPF